MSEKSWNISRRRMLVGSGTALALPMLEGMLFGAQKAELEKSPTRMCSLYFPYGVQMSGEYAWFPTGAGREVTFSKTLESLKERGFSDRIVERFFRPFLGKEYDWSLSPGASFCRRKI